MPLYLFICMFLLCFATRAEAQSDAVFEGRAAAGGMTIEEYNNVPRGMLLTADQIKKMNEDAAKKVAEAGTDKPADTAAAAPAASTPAPAEAQADATAAVDPNAPAPDASTQAVTGNYILSYEEILKLYRQGDFENAEKALIPLVASGHAGAEELMGVMLRLGQGVDKDPAKAFELLRKAADTGRPLAQHHLASMYFTGEGTTADPVQALLWIGLAVIYYPDGPEKEQARKDRDNIFLQVSRRDRDSAQLLKREWLAKRGEEHLLDLQ